MSKRHTQEGWQTPRRLPLIAALLTLLVVTIGLVAGGKIYLAYLAPSTRPPKLAMPSPQLETDQIVPDERRTRHPPRPAGIDKAMAATAADGDAVWSAEK